MALDKDARHRKSIRLPGYDYASEGAYFVTLVAWQRELLFEDPILVTILEEEWQALPVRFPSITLDAFVIMPNHIHLVLWLSNQAVGVPLAGTPTAPFAPAVSLSLLSNSSKINTGSEPAVGAGASPAPTLGAIVGAYKSRVAVRWLAWLKAHDDQRNGKVWQRNYYERIMRNEAELDRTRQYIRDNPANWHADPENPDNVGQHA